jgi:glycosidase
VSRSKAYRRLSALASGVFALSLFSLPFGTAAVRADHTPAPASVNLVGNLQSEATAAACGDWDPGCEGARFSPQGNNVFLFNAAAIPAGDWEYKVALGSWAENYGENFQQDGPDIALNLSEERPVRFYYDHKTHYIADNVRNTIYTVPGDFNQEAGCSGDWQPECLATLMSDVDGDGTFTAEVEDLPAGSYQFKIATNESWSNPNFGQNGGPDNISFNVAGPGTVTFSFNTATNVPGVSVQSSLPAPDNNVEWDGLRHDSRDTLYRTPGGAVEAGSAVTIRLRTFHNDVTAVGLRIYDVNLGGDRVVPMAPAATDVSCYQAGLENKSCDFWAATISEANPNNLWYRFIVTDGSDTDYYGDNTAALDGGLGAASDDPIDFSYALMFYAPGFSAPNWARSAVMYQIFPDRFRNADPSNDPQTGDVRYDDPVVALEWGTLPEGYCRNYADAETNCPWRFDENPPAWSPTKEGPRGRDYFGGDLQGVIEKLDYLKSLGINTIYFNPIFAAKSNHRYDTADYYNIDSALGTNETFIQLVREANRRSMRIIVDNVFNHMSSDSAFFDRYGHYDTVGACESADSVYRDWFVFRAPAGNEPAPCAPSTPGGADTYYTGWFGFDSIPEIRKTNPVVQEYFLTGENNVSSFWLERGASGWRLDVMGDASFPSDYWKTFRQVTRETRPSSLIIGELWQKDSTLLRNLRGETADSTMNYRQRDAIIGLLTPGPFDSKGFGDSGRIIAPTEFAARLEAIREDYPDAAYFSLMNLLGSHDTERILWTLTPGAETIAEKELNAANLAQGKRRLELAALINFSMPGAPTVYYGDEVAMTGDDDPDDRRTYPWSDLGGTPDEAMLDHFQQLAQLRRQTSVLARGDMRVLLADDATGVVAIGRKYRNGATLTLVNRSSEERTVTVPVAGYIPDGVRMRARYGVGNAYEYEVRVENGGVQVTLAPLSGLFLRNFGGDLTPPAVPQNLVVTDESNSSVGLSWSEVSNAVVYNVYRSPLSGGGWVKANDVPIVGTSYTDTGLRNAREYYYIVKALDRVGNESAASNEVLALPHFDIAWANLQWPPSIEHEINIVDSTDSIYGQVWIPEVTKEPGATDGLLAQVGFGPVGSDPAGTDWSWVEASFNAQVGENDEFKAELKPEVVGNFDYVYRYSTTKGREWLYADLNGPVAVGALPGNPGKLMVLSDGDTTPPAVPSGLTVVSASPAGIALMWDVITGDDTLYGYEVRRSDTAGGPYTTIATVTEANYTDTAVASGATYFYTVRAVDFAFNRSADAPEVTATAELRTVTLTFNVTIPTPVEDGIGRSVYIAGFLDRLDGGLPQWNPSGVVLTQVSETRWTITLTGKETTQIEYKYTLGAWDYVEKDGACDEIPNRQLTLSYGESGAQVVNDTVGNWRNVEPCGN